MNNSQFLSTLKPDFISLVEIINNHGFKVGIVGGHVRDFYRQRNQAESFHDYDCEVRPISYKNNLVESFKELKKNLASNYSTRELAFEILRIIGDDFEVELSLPRKESFTDEFHHSNFQATFINDLDYSEGFKRRDITLNAMMFEIYNNEIIFRDPLNGLDDLKNRIISPCSKECFGKDPVRYLRALRFKILLSTDDKAFQLDEAIRKEFPNLKYKDFSLHYLTCEMFKSRKPLRFLVELHSLIGSEISFDQGSMNLFDQLWIAKKKASYFLNALFLPETFFNLISEKLQLKNKRNLSLMPWQLQKETVDSSWINKFEFLQQQDRELIDFYFDSNLIDLSFDELEKINKIKVNLSTIENSHKKEFKYKKQLRIYCDNKKNK